MGVGGNFWDLLKPYARNEGFDFLRDKRVAIDLSFWIVQHETALSKAKARKPHLRLIFFRTINLFSKFGAFPVFVTDGTPSPLKLRARISRFYRSSGVDSSSLAPVEGGVSVERNGAFTKLVQECVELLELFGMPVLKANGEAEALCAQLDREGYVDACITSDSDAFLFGANCVIKSFRSNSKEPFECYYMSDIEAGLGLKRKQLIAIALLVGNDHDLNGVQGIGIETAHRFVQTIGEDEIIDRLHQIGDKDNSFQCGVESLDDISPSKKMNSHCSLCGHPGSKSDHSKYACEYCRTDTEGGCQRKPKGFKCNCVSCDWEREEKKRKKELCWLAKVRTKIAMEPNFPNDEIVEMYLCDNHHCSFTGIDEKPDISWERPKIELLVDFLAFHQHWDPSYIRQRLLPMMSTIFLRDMAVNPANKISLFGQYEFDSISRTKIRYGHSFYVVKWKKDAPSLVGGSGSSSGGSTDTLQDVIDVDEPGFDLLDDEVDVPRVDAESGCKYLLTDENCELVCTAFPEEADRFLRAKELKESKRKKPASSRSEGIKENWETPKSKNVQLNITEFYRSTKVLFPNGPEQDLAMDVDTSSKEGSTKGKRKDVSPNVPKSVRRRLLFG